MSDDLSNLIVGASTSPDMGPKGLGITDSAARSGYSVAVIFYNSVADPKHASVVTAWLQPSISLMATPRIQNFEVSVVVGPTER
jgi:hypothetical protein